MQCLEADEDIVFMSWLYADGIYMPIGWSYLQTPWLWMHPITMALFPSWWWTDLKITMSMTTS